MDTGNTWATAGLIFSGFRDLDIVQIANRISNSFQSLGHRVTSVNIHSDDVALVTTKTHRIRIEAEGDVLLTALDALAGAYLTVSIAARGSGTKFATDSILARVLQSLYTHLSPDYIRWIDSDVVVRSADFARAAGLPQKRKARPETALKPVRKIVLPSIDDTYEALEERFEAKDPVIVAAQSTTDKLRSVFTQPEPEPEKPAKVHIEDEPEVNARLRLSAWFISIAVAIFALPVGTMLVVFNLLRGENLRLASQTAALTGMFIALQAYGSAAQAMTAIQRVLG